MKILKMLKILKILKMFKGFMRFKIGNIKKEEGNLEEIRSYIK